MASRDIEHLLRLAVCYGSAKALTLSTVSLYAAGQGQLLARLQAGCGITVARRERCLQWFADHWPEDLSWPDDIDRPAPAGTARSRPHQQHYTALYSNRQPGRARLMKSGP